MSLKMNEIEEFLVQLKIHNEQFVLKNFESYRLYDKPFRSAHQMFLRKYFKLTKYKFLCNAMVGWGLHKNTVMLFKEAVKKKVPFFLIEDGFIRSLYTYLADVDPVKKSGISYCVDTKGFYFDGNVETDLEILLNNYVCTDEEKAYAEMIRKKIIENKISKYNNQALDLDEEYFNNSKKVLIIDQSYGDMSLIRGGITDDVFIQMITDAVKENPESDVLFKVHPDTIALNKKTEFLAKLPANVKLVDCPVNPYTLLSCVDKVYVATSQMGLEALFMGKEVHVYGLPFYAGWGLTKDKIQVCRRKRVLSIQEFIYIVYVVYSRYVNPILNAKCDVNVAIDYIKKMRDRYIK